MNKTQIQAKLQSMKGRMYEYASEIHTVKSYEVDAIAERFTLHTDKKSFRKLFTSADLFFKEWLDQHVNRSIDHLQEVVKSSSDEFPPDSRELQTVPGESNIADDLIKILMDGITKVKQNAGYIPQAKAINNNVNSILHVKRMQLDYMKHLKGVSKKDNQGEEPIKIKGRLKK